MGSYITRRLIQAVFTVFGVLLITFILFRVVAGDIAAAHLGPKATLQQRTEWLHKYGYDKPLFVNVRPGQHWWDSQFAHYTMTTVTFRTRSLITNELLNDIIVRRAPYSLALTVPSLAI